MLLKKETLGNKIFIVLFIVIGSILLTACLSIAYQNWEYHNSLLPRNSKGIATVGKLVKKYNNTYNHHIFFTFNGESFEVNHRQNGMKKKYKLNQKFEVLYNPAQPERAILNIPEELEAVDSLMSGMLIFIILFSFVIVLLSRHLLQLSP